MILREIVESDLLAIFEHESDAEACRMAAYPLRDRETFLSHWREKILRDPSTKKRAICIGEEVVGSIVSWAENERRFVGYWIGKAYWGRGIAALALRKFTLEIEKTRPLFASVATINKRSYRVLEKCSFIQVGGATVGSDGVEEVLFQLH
jgi:RimJ/RimL family protein N-acetyltransferase